MLKVASITNNKHLEFVWTFAPEVKKHGILKFTEQLSPSGYSAKLTNGNGDIVTDKATWDLVHEVFENHKTSRKMIKC